VETTVCPAFHPTSCNAWHSVPHSTCEATLNNRSTAAELGSVALLLQKASAMDG